MLMSSSEIVTCIPPSAIRASSFDYIIPELGFSEIIFQKFCDRNTWICDKSGYN